MSVDNAKVGKASDLLHKAIKYDQVVVLALELVKDRIGPVVDRQNRELDGVIAYVKENARILGELKMILRQLGSGGLTVYASPLVASQNQ
ncbi:MAG TPA: hypothetical protein VFF30_01470 [Nitrososphaerales archaeon]|nr:hypothetical protein [Nitrososphaerales archaeon]